MPASVQASRTRRACASGLGSEMPLVWPSWFSAVPTITPWIGSPSAIACERRFSSTMPAPSPRTKPLAEASNALHSPSGESIDACENPMKPPGVIITVTPPASAVSPRPAQMCSQAACTAVSADEHAVSMATLGPRRLKQ